MQAFTPKIAIMAATAYFHRKALPAPRFEAFSGLDRRSRKVVRRLGAFLRLDDARNQDEGGTGLGLAIARDIARSHGGEIVLSDSPLGGLRAAVRVPV